MRKRWMVRDVMTPVVVSVAPGTGYKEIVETMLRNGVGALPVVDADGRVLGVVSELDLLHKVEFAAAEPHRRLFERRQERVARAKGDADTAEELMTAPAVVVREDETVAGAAVRLHREGVKRMPVVDAEGNLVGIVSRGDVLRGYLRTDDDIRLEVVEDILRRGMWLEPYQVDVAVRQGVVTLTGHLDRRSMAEVVVQLVRATHGVVDVVDELTFHVDDSVDSRLSRR